MISATRRDRAFTLLELMLATLIGGIVTIAAWGVFRYVARAQDLQQQRMVVASDMAVAHRALSRAFQMMVMSSEPTPRDEELKARKDRTRRAEKDDTIADPPEDVMQTRLRVAPGRARAVASADRLVPTQLVEVALRAPAVLGGLPALPSEEAITGVVLASRYSSRNDDRGRSGKSSRAEGRDKGRETKGKGKEGKSSGGSELGGGDGKKPKAPSKGSTGNSAADAALNAAGDAAEGGEGTGSTFGDEVSSTRQPGVRAVFELLPDGEVPDTLLDADDQTVRLSLRRPLDELQKLGGLSLWYRELPPEDAEGEFLQRRAIRLLSGLRDVAWRVYREDIAESRITAIWANELPAYITFEFTSHDDRRERWMFEVGWAQGSMPGELKNEAAERASRLTDGQPVNTTNQGGNPNPPPSSP